MNAVTVRIILIALGLGGMLTGVTPGVFHTAPATVERVQTTPEPLEDEPGFDCTKHGNRVCGPDANTLPFCEDATFNWDGTTLTPAPRNYPELPACE